MFCRRILRGRLWLRMIFLTRSWILLWGATCKFHRMGPRESCPGLDGELPCCGIIQWTLIRQGRRQEPGLLAQINPETGPSSSLAWRQTLCFSSSKLPSGRWICIGPIFLIGGSLDLEFQTINFGMLLHRFQLPHSLRSAMPARSYLLVRQ